MYYLTPFPTNRNGRSNAAKIGDILNIREITYLDVTQMKITEFLQNIAKEDRITSPAEMGRALL